MGMAALKLKTAIYNINPTLMLKVYNYIHETSLTDNKDEIVIIGGKK